MTENPFIWWHVVEGVARGHNDTPAVRKLVDSNPRDWCGTIEGAILHGGVIATAFKRTTEPVYDSMAWLKTRKLVAAGEITTTEITASREHPKP